MTSINNKLYIYIIIVSIILILVFLLIKFYISICYEKRIKRFSLDAPRENYQSFADKAISFLNKLTKKLSKGLIKSDASRRYAKRFEKYIEYNTTKNNLEPIDYISIKIFVMLGFQILYLISLTIRLYKFNMFTFLLISIFGFFLTDIVVAIIYKRTRKLLEDQLLQAIVIMNGAFKSGKNIHNALDIVRTELPNPIRAEFEIVYKDINYGLSLYEAFDRFADRIKLEQAKYITTSLALLSRTGGNIVTVFEMIEKSFYNRMKIKQELMTLTASSKFLYKMLIFIPLGIILLIVCLDPSYFLPLITSELGILITCIILVLYLVYIVLIKRVMRVEEV